VPARWSQGSDEAEAIENIKDAIRDIWLSSRTSSRV
jgi:predicted RNase H-like HicB family nuclease